MSPGLVQGTPSTEGKIYVESNGTMSVIGWDSVKADIFNLDSSLDTKQDELVSGVNIKTINDASLLGSGDITISFNGIAYLKDPDKTYLVIKTPADNDTFTLLTGITGSPNYTIEWGDGDSETITTTDNPSHEYATAGMYLITISGSFSNGILYGFSDNENKSKIIEVYGGSNYPLSIEYAAFDGCTSLTIANIPKATSLGNSAFYDCTSLTAANFPQVTTIESGAFEECTSLTTANFTNATSIGDAAFFGCQSLTTVNFPNATDISGSAFSNCTSLTTANFPQVMSIGGYAFEDCSSLKELTIGNVTTTTTGTKFENVKLTNLTIAQDVTDADIERILQFYSDNGGTFIGTDVNIQQAIDEVYNSVVKLTGNQTVTGIKTFNAPTNIAGTEQATTKFMASNGGSITIGKEGPNSGTMLKFCQVDGTPRLLFRSSASTGAMVWSQPEQGAQLYIDLGLAGSDYHRITMPSSGGTLALTSQIPSTANLVTTNTTQTIISTKTFGVINAGAINVNEINLLV